MEQRIIAALSELSPDDRALAEAQKVCPVSGEPLGSMGAPVKIELEGDSLFLCCDGCEDLAKIKSKEILAKMNQAAAK